MARLRVEGGVEDRGDAEDGAATFGGRGISEWAGGEDGGEDGPPSGSSVLSALDRPCISGEYALC